MRFKQLEYTKATSPVEVRLFGEDLNALQEASDSVTRIMQHMEELTMVCSSNEGTTPGLEVIMHSDEANRMGINRTLLSLNLATRYIGGLPVTTIWEGDYPLSVNLKDINSMNGNISSIDLGNAMVGGIVPRLNVPLRQVAEVEPVWNIGSIQHRNGMRIVSVNADLKRWANNNDATDKLIEHMKKLQLPNGVTYKIGGQRADDIETIPQIFGCLVLSIAIIAFILIFHFKNIRLAMIIFLALSFSVPGTALGIWIMGQAMSITSILGIVSLMGIIVRNGIIMIDYAEELRIKHKMTAKDAAINAAKRRMRPIFLTSAAASMGVIPMVLKNNPLWGPMGVVVCFGTLVSMVFIVTMIPVAYWMIFRISDNKKKNKANKKNLQAISLK